MDLSKAKNPKLLLKNPNQIMMNFGVENLKQELIKLNRQQNGKANELARRMFDSGGVLFELNGEEFHLGMLPQQKLYLYRFCNKPQDERTKLAEANLIEKIC